MPPRRKSPKRRSSRPGANYHLKVALAALFLLGFLIVALVLLSELSEYLRPASDPVPAVAPSFDRLPPEIEDAPVSPAPVVPAPEWSGGPRLAIIMDDLGGDMATARELLRIDLPVTFSILPNTAQAARVATLAHRRAREVLIHLPMEPKGYPESNPGTDALFLDLAPEEIRRRMIRYLEVIPYATGGNNHMGSLFTESPPGMAPVLEVMKEEGLFFVDSLTSARSVAYAEARRIGIPAVIRDVFLDNERDVELILRQIRMLTAQAARNGQAVGICHPYPETLEALRQAVPYLAQEGVTVVPVSRLLVR